MDAAQYRLDNLAKPIHSLGYLEWIAVQLAGATHCEQPPLDIRAALLLITEKKELPADLTRILNALTDVHSIPIDMLPIIQCTEKNADTYKTAYDLAHSYPLLILGTYETTENSAAQFLADALRGAAAGGSLILPGDARADNIAHKTEENAPTLAPFILHVLPDMLTLDAHLTAGIAGILGIEIVRAALHVINDMKTFTETGVAVAIDGAGAGRQVRGQTKK